MTGLQRDTSGRTTGLQRAGGQQSRSRPQIPTGLQEGTGSWGRALAVPIVVPDPSPCPTTRTIGAVHPAAAPQPMGDGTSPQVPCSRFGAGDNAGRAPRVQAAADSVIASVCLNICAERQSPGLAGKSLPTEVAVKGLIGTKITGVQGNRSELTK